MAVLTSALLLFLMSQLVQVNCQGSNPCEDKKYGKVSYPTSCSKYYECNNYKGVEKSCPTGQHFSVKSKSCVPVRQSGCYLSTTAVTVRKGPGSVTRFPRPGPGSGSGPGSGHGSRCKPYMKNLDLFVKYEDLGKTYYISKDSYSTVADAAATCTTLCAYLAEIDDKAEGNRVIAMMARLNTLGLLIAGSDKLKEGHWVYDRTGKSAKYFDWCNGEPNNQNDEDCVAYNKHQACVWDFPCSFRYAPVHLYYICEK
ncbi:unnamed protein product [Lymnaea stagnalis]|uniref:C-type lectin domain-containing protein n=1 Tax=Lymnaea stagnalis TaxID=6523 RepID=A0AAV2I5D0_LYMST